MNCPQCGALIHGNFSVKTEKECPCDDVKMLIKDVKEIIRAYGNEAKMKHWKELRDRVKKVEVGI
jgi:hypothetical protein